MPKSTQAFNLTRAAFGSAFGCLRTVFFSAFFSALSSVATAEEFSLSELETLIDLCVDETDLNFENRPGLRSLDSNSKFSEVLLDEAEQFAETSKAKLLFPEVRWLFDPEVSNSLRADIPEAMARKLQLDLALEYNLKNVRRQIEAHAKLKSSNSRDGEWNDFGIVGGSAWWYSKEVSVIWKDSGFIVPGSVCEIFGVPAQIARKFVDGTEWRFETENRGPFTLYTATKKAFAPTSRTLVRLITGVGKKHRLPSAIVAAIEIEPGFASETDSGEWVIIVSDSRYHDLL